MMHADVCVKLAGLRHDENHLLQLMLHLVAPLPNLLRPIVPISESITSGGFFLTALSLSSHLDSRADRNSQPLQRYCHHHHSAPHPPPSHLLCPMVPRFGSSAADSFLLAVLGLSSILDGL